MVCVITYLVESFVFDVLIVWVVAPGVIVFCYTGVYMLTAFSKWSHVSHVFLCSLVNLHRPCVPFTFLKQMSMGRSWKHSHLNGKSKKVQHRTKCQSHSHLNRKSSACAARHTMNLLYDDEWWLCCPCQLQLSSDKSCALSSLKAHINRSLLALLVRPQVLDAP